MHYVIHPEGESIKVKATPRNDGGVVLKGLGQDYETRMTLEEFSKLPKEPVIDTGWRWQILVLQYLAMVVFVGLGLFPLMLERYKARRLRERLEFESEGS